MISHYPTKKLTEHIKEVQDGADFLLTHHSDKLKKIMSLKLLEYIISKHDEGKKTDYFQKYIKSPFVYTGNEQLKQHSKLSTLLAITQFNTSNILERFQILQCIGGHHTSLKSLDDIISYWSSSERNLKKQIDKLPTEINIEKIDNNGLTDYIYDLLEDKIKVIISEQIIDDALNFRLQTQLLYSILLESDKALLAVPDYVKHESFTRNIWNKKWVDEFIGNPKQTSMNLLRESIRDKMLENMGKESKFQLFTLTSPTGSGKTLLSATWALEQREKLQLEKIVTPKIIIVLPFLSIINQTVDEYKKILSNAKIKFDGSWLLASHSLSDRRYSQTLEDNEESFFIDTWRSDVIITTYDQFLYSVFNPKAKHQMRFHNLLDSIIVFDEIQSLPTMLWNPLNEILKTITNLSESKVLLMSATMPKFISDSNDLLPDYKYFFQTLNRYEIELSYIKNNQSFTVDEFCETIKDEISIWIKKGERVLLTCNTRKSAQDVFLKIKEVVQIIDDTFPMFFISSDIVPADRLKKIEKINQNKPCIVVSTQSIEAGVDIDMTKVYRDFAPLDSLIQIAGRCNRNAKYKIPKPITIIQLKSNKGNLYSGMIYNEVHLYATREVLKDITILPEKDVLLISDNYFSILSKTTNTGVSYIQKFAYWKDYENIREVLRGKEIEKYEFCLLDRDLELKEQIKIIAKIEDRWIRREKFRRISGKIAELTVSVIAKRGFSPGEIACEYYGIWNLGLDYYNENIGIVIPDYNNMSSFVF